MVLSSITLPPKVKNDSQGGIVLVVKKLTLTDGSFPVNARISFTWWGVQELTTLYIPWKQHILESEMEFPICTDYFNFCQYLIDMHEMIIDVYDSKNELIGKGILSLDQFVKNSCNLDDEIYIYATKGWSITKKIVGKLMLSIKSVMKAKPSDKSPDRARKISSEEKNAPAINSFQRNEVIFIILKYQYVCLILK